MAAYYHSHHHHNNHNNNNPGTSSTDIQDHNTNNFHTLILMNPNLADPPRHHHHQPPPPLQTPQSHNILLLNSAASVAAGLSSPQPLLPPHHFVRLPTSPPQSNNITLYGYPSHEARDIPRARQGLSLSLSSQNPALGGSHQGGEGDVAGGGQGFVLGSKYLKAAQELLEEVVHVGDDGGFNIKNSSTNTNANTDGSPKKGNTAVAESLSEERDKLSSGGGGSGGQLSTAERQEIQMKKAKLVTMLDEV